MRKDVLVYFAGKLIPAFVNLAVIVLAVRWLGEYGYGRYTLVFNAAILLSTLSIGWIQQGILRFLSAYPDERRLTVSRFFYLAVISSAGAVAACLAVNLAYLRLPLAESLVVCVFVFLYNLLLFHLSLSQADRRSLHYATLEGTYNLLFLLLFAAIAFLAGYRHYDVLFISMATALLVTELLRRTVLPSAPGDRDPYTVSFNPAFSGKVFRFGFPVTIWLFLSTLLTVLDRYIIGHYAGYDDVGAYSAVKDLIVKISTFTTIPVLLAFHPAIVERWNEGRQSEAHALVRQGLRYCLVIAIAVMVLFIPARDLVFGRMLHLQIESGLAVTVSLLLSSFLWQAAMLIHKPLELRLRPNLMLAAILVALAVNASGNFLFIPRYGYTASALAALASVVVYILVVLVFVAGLRHNK